MDFDSKLYEISYFLRADSEEEGLKTMDKIRKHIEDGSGAVHDTSRLETRKISYPILKTNEALFGHMKFFLKEERLSGLKEIMESEKNILRFILVKTKAAETRQRSISSKESKITRMPEEPAADIESIDKKLEEILGK